MIESSQLIVFVSASVALVATPGPAVVYLIALSVREGKRIGLVSAAGVAIGNFGHAILTAVGLSALLAASPLAYSILKYMGVGYLFYLGIRTLFFTGIGKSDQKPHKATRRKRGYFAQGILVGLFNPKVALFFLAFLPQFANAAQGMLWAQLLFLGAVFVFVGWLGDSTWALMSGLLSDRIRGSERFDKWSRIGSGFVFCILGTVTLTL